MKKVLPIALAFALSAAAGSAQAVNISFTGNFNLDDDVQLFNFTTDGVSEVFLVSYGYGGGTQADGNVVSDGGIDTILTLFDSTGALINSNDDGSSTCFSNASAVGGSGGNADPGTGATFDTCLSSVLAAGDYTVAVTQFNNFANGPNLSNGFLRDGDTTFTSSFGCSNGIFCDVTQDNRTSAWAYDILNVVNATQVSEPWTLSLLAGSVLVAGMRTRRRRI